MGITDKIKEIEAEISRTQKNKATEYHLGLLKAKLAKYRSQLLEPEKKTGPGGRGTGFDVMKSGDARVALVGLPSVGKSTLLNKLTSSKSEVADYAFTTLTCIAGKLRINGATIQLLDLPGIIEGAAAGIGRGRQVISTARTADLILLMLDSSRGNRDRRLLEAELFKAGIRLNKDPPNIFFSRKEKGGVHFNSSVPLTKVNEKMVNLILKEYKIFSAEVVFREDATVDDLIDVIEGNVKYIKCVYAYNKVDTASIELVDKLAQQPFSCMTSCTWDWTFDAVKEMIWDRLSLTRVYTKRSGVAPDFEEAIILRKGCTVEHVCHAIHRSLVSEFKYGLVWGRSSKHQPQKVGIHHPLCDEDVVQIVKNVK